MKNELANAEYISQKDLVEKLKLLAQNMGTQSALANKIGISEQYLSDIISKRRDPGAAVLKFLKIEKVNVYKEIR